MLHDLFILLTITNQSSDFHDPPEVASKKYPCHNMTGKQNVVVDRKHILCLFWKVMKKIANMSCSKITYNF
jgi:hypothetical protein